MERQELIQKEATTAEKSNLVKFRLDYFDKTLMFPFFIDKIDHYFFNEEQMLKHHPHKLFENPKKKFQSAMLKVFSGYSDAVTMSNERRIQIILNKVMNQFSRVTGKRANQFFRAIGEENGEKTFVEFDEDYALRDEILGNYHDDKRYAFKINVNPDSLMARLAKKINFCFYIDHTKKKVLGSFSYDSFNRKDHGLVEAVDDFYFSNFIFQFIKEQFFPLCLENILNLFRDENNYDNHDQETIRMENAVDFKKVSLEQLEHHWQDNIKRKFIFYKIDITPEEKDYLLYDLFYEIMTIILIMVFAIEEIKNIFTIDNIDEAAATFKLAKDQPKINQEIKQDFVDFAKFVEKLHMENYKERKKTLDERIQLTHLDRSFEYYYFCDPVLVNNFSIGTLVNPTQLRQFFKDNPDYFNYLFLSLYPEYFRLSEVNVSNFEPLPVVKLNFLKLYKFDYDKYLDHMMEHVCENDLYVHSFIRRSSVAIFNCFDKSEMQFKSSYRPYYYWSEIFMQVRLYELQFISQVKAIIRGSKVKWKNILYRKALRDLHDMYYDEQNHFFGLGNILIIIERISKETSFTDRFDEVNTAVQFEDELWKRGTERSNFMMAFLVAIMVGGLNYLSMVFSATSDSSIVGNGWPGVDVGFPWVFTSIACCAAIEFTNVCILTFAFFRVVYITKKFNEIDNHCFEK